MGIFFSTSHFGSLYCTCLSQRFHPAAYWRIVLVTWFPPSIQDPSSVPCQIILKIAVVALTDFLMPEICNDFWNYAVMIADIIVFVLVITVNMHDFFSVLSLWKYWLVNISIMIFFPHCIHWPSAWCHNFIDGENLDWKRNEKIHCLYIN